MNKNKPNEIIDEIFKEFEERTNNEEIIECIAGERHHTMSSVGLNMASRFLK